MPAPPPDPRPHPLLTKANRRLAADGVFTWTIPALSARIDGTTVSTCPSAGICAAACYALAGNYLRTNVRRRHLANLRYLVEDLPGWERAMTTELTARRFHGAWIRIHSAGDFFSSEYTRAWLRIITATPAARFYTYTKEIRRFKDVVEPDAPQNFQWVYSFGGRQDALLDPDIDRTADVFPDEAAIPAGWHSQRDSDLLAVTGPAPVAVLANNIPHLRARQGDRSFRQWQAESDARRQHRHRHSRSAASLRQQPRHGPASLMRAASPDHSRQRRTSGDPAADNTQEPASGEASREEAPHW